MERKVRFILLLHEDWNEIHRLKDILSECKGYSFEIEYRQEIKEGIQCLKENTLEVIFLSHKLARKSPELLARNPYTKFILILNPVEYMLLAHMKSPGIEHVLIEGESDLNDILEVLKSKQILPAASQSNIHRELLGNLSLPITITSGKHPNWVLTFVNNAMEELIGYPANELLNKPYNVLFKTGFNEKKIKLVEIAMEAKDRWSGELLCSKKNGETFWNQINIDPVFDLEQNFLHYTWLHQDITKDKNEKKKLEARNQELNTFMYRSSHDMRGPLNSNIGLLSLMKEETDNQSFKYYLELMEKSLTRLNENLLELVELTKIREGAANVQLVNLKEVVDTVAGHYANKLEQGKFKLKVEVADDLEINSDPALIRAVLQNLIENSIKYHDPEKTVCSVVLKAFVVDKGLGVLIEDNGIGIPERSQSKVFEMFFRANTATEGSGLGLYIVKNCLEKLHGSCSFTSREKIGTTFELNIPDLKLISTSDFEYA